MAGKRSHDDFEGGELAGGRTKRTRANDNGEPVPKHSKFGSKVKHKAKEGSAEWTRKRARTIQRLLQRNQELPANVRNDLEREYAAHRDATADRSFHRRRSAMISKYHMVRFFERKKATRLVKQLERRLDETTDVAEKERVTKEIHIARVDEAYTLYHPHAEPYVSLYGNASKKKELADDPSPAAKVALKAERPPIWSVVESAIADGPGALRRLRERRSADGAHEEQSSKLKNKRQRESNRNVQRPSNATETKPISRPKETVEPSNLAPNRHDQSQSQRLNRRERRHIMRQSGPSTNQGDGGDDDDDDDGGFFEEV